MLARVRLSCGSGDALAQELSLYESGGFDIISQVLAQPSMPRLRSLKTYKTDSGPAEPFAPL